MKKYCLTSTKFTGEVLYLFNDNDRLVELKISAEMEPEKHSILISWTPETIEHLMAFQKQYNLNLKEVPVEITFEVFWEEFNYKVDKQMAVKEWDKLDEPSQAKAIAKAKAYRAFCARKGTALIYPSRYLKNRRFDDAM